MVDFWFHEKSDLGYMTNGDSRKNTNRSHLGQMTNRILIKLTDLIQYFLLQ